MADFFDLLSNGQLVEKKEIVEGLNPPVNFEEKIRSFFPEEIYNLNRDSLLYKFLYALLGDAGVNGAKKAFLAPKLFQSLSTTNFNDLDSLFANSFQLSRLSEEIYTYDPYSQMLTQDQWSEIRRKDAWYKARSQDYMRGISFGNSPNGVKLLGRAATGYECEIFERWEYLDDIHSDQPIGIPDYGITNSPEEVVLSPEVDALTEQERRRFNTVIDRLKPANSIITINPLASGLEEVSITSGTSSSNNFYVKRQVVGNSIIDYSYTKNNNWIETGISKEAPFQAYADRSESVTYLTPNTVSSSSFHLGNFSSDQQRLFPHLSKESNTYPYIANEAISENPDSYKFTAPWLARGTNKESFMINDHYPVGYLADENFMLNKSQKLFWASKEDYAPVSEYLEVDLGSIRPLNLLEFEISQKPIDIEVSYFDEDSQSWEPVIYNENVENETSIKYLETSEYSWQNLSLYFETVQSRKLKINFVRRTDKFPNSNSPSIVWSIEVRNLKVAHAVFTANEFISNSGVDILGNSYSTELEEFTADRAFDGNENTYWQSQINPSRFAVDSLYFDIQQNGEASFIDEIYIDPLTPQSLMHIYWSVDDQESDWDNKLWNPVPRHYLLTRGNLKLYETIHAKYIKLEFTKQTPVPYNVLNSSINVEKTYRLFPSWVESYVFDSQNYYNLNNPLEETQEYVAVIPTPVSLGLLSPEMDKLKDEEPRTIKNYLKNDRKSSVLSEYQIWKNPELKEGNDPVLDSPISLYPNVYSNLYQQNILATITSDEKNQEYNFIKVNEDEFNWVPENPLSPNPLVTVATKEDRTEVVSEKNWPDMWFMRKCRHAYKVVKAQRSANVGYSVAIREIKFYKRDKTVRRDNPSYVETLLDSSSVFFNSFDQKDWRWVLPAEKIRTVGNENIVQYASEDFNGVVF
jgi:hypothetical protein